jgi:hypothetical protein
MTDSNRRDREQRDQSGEGETELPVDDLNPPGMKPTAAEQVKGGLLVTPVVSSITIPTPTIVKLEKSM